MRRLWITMVVMWGKMWMFCILFVYCDREDVFQNVFAVMV